MEKSKEINYRKSSIPSGPGPQQITTEGCESKKGGAPFVSQLPKEHVVPGSKK
jgi:hypothetical protein